MISGNDKGTVNNKWCHHEKPAYAASLLCLLVCIWQISAQSFMDQAMLMRLQKNYGDAAHQRGVVLHQLLTDARTMAEPQQLLEINRFFNQFAYAEDLDQWRASDYWATPEEFIGTNKGDCEDYVIAKYFALRALGVSEKKLYLTYVKASKLNVAHMVLTYFKTPQSIPLVLDNYDKRVLPATKRKDLLPVYSFNAKSLFLTNPSAGLGQKLPTDKIKNSKWTGLLDSLQERAQ